MAIGNNPRFPRPAAGHTRHVGLRIVDVDLRWKNTRVEQFTTRVDPEDPEDVQILLWDAARRDSRRLPEDRRIYEYEIRVYDHKNSRQLLTYVGRSG